MSDTEDRMESQFEHMEDATPGGPRDGGPGWFRRFRRQQKRDAAAGVPHGIRDHVSAAYYRLSLPARAVLWIVVIAFFAAIPILTRISVQYSESEVMYGMRDGIAAKNAMTTIHMTARAGRLKR